MSNNDRYNEALKIFQEFGPRRSLPIRERWREAFPQVPPDVMDEWETEFKKLEEFAYDLAAKVQNSELDDSDAYRMLAERFRWLDRDRLDKTYSQAAYFVRK